MNPMKRLLSLAALLPLAALPAVAAAPAYAVGGSVDLAGGRTAAPAVTGVSAVRGAEWSSGRGSEQVAGRGFEWSSERGAEQGAGRAAELLAVLAAHFRSFASYEVGFAVTAGDRRVTGRYAVAGDDYYIAVEDAEVFSDGGVRREIDNRRREVTLTEVEPASRNLLSNPARAFDLLDGHCRPELLWERGGRAAVRLNAADGIPGTVTVTLDAATGRPIELLYDYDGEQVAIEVVRIVPGIALPVFDAARYAGYEVIDFR